jgi:Cysteinyl-tRNA synthetase
MVAMIQTLVDRGHAYVAEGHVLFDVPSMPDYGELARRSQDDMIAGARVEVAPYKKHAADFVLWKPSDASQPGWPSPWGRGQAGLAYRMLGHGGSQLGVTFDIHGGGIDLIFPHHENEIAQSRSAHDGAPLARVWMHNGFVQVNGEKMSKSLGNYFTVHELLEEGYRGEAIRLALLAAHYRQPVDFTRAGLAEASGQLDRFYLALERVIDVEAEPGEPPADLLAALEDDLNTPWRWRICMRPPPASTRRSGREQVAAKASLLAGADLLGLLKQRPADWLQGGKKGGPEAARSRP